MRITKYHSTSVILGSPFIQQRKGLCVGKRRLELHLIFRTREIRICYSTTFSSPLRGTAIETQTGFMKRSTIWPFYSPRVSESGPWVLYPFMEKMSLSLLFWLLSSSLFKILLLHNIFNARSYIKDSKNLSTSNIITSKSEVRKKRAVSYKRVAGHVNHIKSWNYGNLEQWSALYNLLCHTHIFSPNAEDKLPLLPAII